MNSLKEAMAAGGRLAEEGNYQNAVERYDRALKLSRKLGIKADEVRALMQLGLLTWNIGRMNDSSSFYDQARAVARREGSRREEQGCETALNILKLYAKGKDSRASNQFDQSIKCFGEAVRLARCLNSPHHEVKCLRQLSINYWEKNDIEEFYRINSRAQKLASEIKNRKEEGMCFNNIGIYLLKRSDYSNALKCFQISRGIAEKENLNEMKMLCDSNISLIYTDLGEYKKALDYLLNVIKIDKERGDNYFISIDLNNIGIIYKKMGLMTNKKEDIQKAIDFYDEALSLARKISNMKLEYNVLNNIGEAYAGLKEYRQALKYFHLGLRIAKESSDTELVSLILNNLGNAHLDLDDYEKAHEYYDQAIGLAVKINSGKVLWEAYFGLGQCFEKKGEYVRAAEYYQKSVETIDMIRSHIFLDVFKTGYARNKASVYEHLVNLLWNMGIQGNKKPPGERMFYFVEKNKARAFVECLMESKIDIQKNMSREQRLEVDEAAGRISTLLFDIAKPGHTGRNRQELQESLSREEENYMRLMSKIRAENPAAASLLSPEPCPLDLLQTRLLDEKTALVEYYLGEERSFLLFITKKECEIFELPARPRIENSIQGYLKYLSSSPRGEFDGKIAAGRIYKELLFPLDDRKYSRIEKLIIVPDGILYYLPFEALSSAAPGSVSSYVVDRYQVSYAPSASGFQFLFDNKEDQETYSGLLAFGDPVYAERGASAGDSANGGDILTEIYAGQGFVFTPIPFSRNEVKAISKYFPKNQRFIYLGEKACEGVIKTDSRRNYQVIHFACHGLLDERQPIRSALVLSRDRENKDDGFLQVRELYNLRLYANLVVLSACQTGKGALEKGEGILGLPRIFFYAGAKSVLSTLWSINDRSTSFFMKRFYGNLADGFSKGQALRLAKQEMIRSKYDHPYYWAGFVLNGEPDSRIRFH